MCVGWKHCAAPGPWNAWPMAFGAYRLTSCHALKRTMRSGRRVLREMLAHQF
jgi:hypothetical protein